MTGEKEQGYRDEEYNCGNCWACSEVIPIDQDCLESADVCGFIFIR